MREFECEGNLSAKALGNLLKGENCIVVGDYVEVVDGVIQSVYPRTNEIFRQIIREQKKKVSAANVDYLLIVSSASTPLYKRGVVDRFLLRAIQWDIAPIVILNKMDEATEDFSFEQKRLVDLGVTFAAISTKKTGQKFVESMWSFDELKKQLKGKTSIVVGQSGVGKSSLVNALTHGAFDLKSFSVGKKGKGVHTTTWSELIQYEEISLIDSPGIRSFGVEDIKSTELIHLFPDLEKKANKCRFQRCDHSEKARDCAFVGESLEVLSRLDSYLKILEEIAAVPDFLKKS